MDLMKMGRTALARTMLMAVPTIFASQFAYACGICTTLISDYFLPPILFWAAAGILLFLIQLELLRRHKIKLPGYPSLWLGILIIFVLFIGAVAEIGLEIFIILLIPVIFLAIKALSSGGVSDWPEAFRKTERRFGILALIVISALLISSAYIQVTRSRVDYILQWPGSPLSKGWIKNFGVQGAKGLADLRTLAVKGKPYAISQALTVLADHGNAKEDMPLMIDGLRLVYQAREKEHLQAIDWDIESIEAALCKLSGLDLPKGTKPDEWERKWIEKNKVNSILNELPRVLNDGNMDIGARIGKKNSTGKCDEIIYPIGPDIEPPARIGKMDNFENCYPGEWKGNIELTYKLAIDQNGSVKNVSLENTAEPLPPYVCTETISQSLYKMKFKPAYKKSTHEIVSSYFMMHITFDLR